MTFRNFMPHSADFFKESDFKGLEQVNKTTWIADDVSDQAYLSVPSEGSLRIGTKTVESTPIAGVPVVETSYGELENHGKNGVIPMPDIKADDVLIVSLPTASMSKGAGHPLASQMVYPYKVVRQRGNTSNVLGAMGLSK